MSAQHETEGQLPQGEFPASKSKSLGQFWLPVSPDSRVSGLLEIDDTTVRLEVSPELTPWYVRTPQAGGGYAVSRAARKRNIPGLLALQEVTAILTTAWPNSDFREAVGRLAPQLDCKCFATSSHTASPDSGDGFLYSLRLALRA